MSNIITLGFQYENTDYKSVFDFGDFLRKTCMLMKETPKKWEFLCRVDQIQNTLHVSAEVYASKLEYFVMDYADYLKGRPYDDHFIAEKSDI